MSSFGSGERNGSSSRTASEALAPLAIVIDRACVEILQSQREGRDVTHLSVSPDVYRAVAALRTSELQRGYPLMLLDLELVADASLGQEDARVA